MLMPKQNQGGLKMEQKEIIQEFRMMRAELQKREEIISSLIYKTTR